MKRIVVIADITWAIARCSNFPKAVCPVNRVAKVLYTYKL